MSRFLGKSNMNPWIIWIWMQIVPMFIHQKVNIITVSVSKIRCISVGFVKYLQRIHKCASFRSNFIVFSMKSCGIVQGSQNIGMYKPFSSLLTITYSCANVAHFIWKTLYLSFCKMNLANLPNIAKMFSFYTKHLKSWKCSQCRFKSFQNEIKKN